MKRINEITIEKNQNSINSLEFELTHPDLDNFQIWFKNRRPISFESMTLKQAIIYKSILIFTREMKVLHVKDFDNTIFYDFEINNQTSENYFVEIDLIETENSSTFYLECYCYNNKERLSGKACSIAISNVSSETQFYSKNDNATKIYK